MLGSIDRFTSVILRFNREQFKKGRELIKSEGQWVAPWPGFKKGEMREKGRNKLTCQKKY